MMSVTFPVLKLYVPSAISSLIFRGLSAQQKLWTGLFFFFSFFLQSSHF